MKIEYNGLGGWLDIIVACILIPIGLAIFVAKVWVAILVLRALGVGI